MFKVLYILFFMAIIVLLQYLLNKPETYNNNQNKSNTSDSSDSSDSSDPCLNFNYILQHYSKCCSPAKKNIGCRKPLCDSAKTSYDQKVTEYSTLKNDNLQLNRNSIELKKQNDKMKKIQGILNTKLSNLKNKKNLLVDYMEYPGVLSLGDSSESSDIPEADDNGCLDNISLETAKNTCNDSSDCNSFVSYDPSSNAKVCFKSVYGQSGEISNGTADNSFFVKVE